MIANKLPHFTIPPTFFVLAARVRFASDYVQMFSRNDSQAKCHRQQTAEECRCLHERQARIIIYGNLESPKVGTLAIAAIVGGEVGSTTKCGIFLNENNCASDRIFDTNNCSRCLVKRIAKNDDIPKVSYRNCLLICK